MTISNQTEIDDYNNLKRHAEKRLNQIRNKAKQLEVILLIAQAVHEREDLENVDKSRYFVDTISLIEKEYRFRPR